MAHVTDKPLIEHLRNVADLVQHADAPSLVLLASSELGPMAEALLAVLTDHAPDARGRCRSCSAWWRLWRRRHPCRVWALTGHQLMVAPSDRPTGPVFAVEGPL